mgnify:CR=1 FL=1
MRNSPELQNIAGLQRLFASHRKTIEQPAGLAAVQHRIGATGIDFRQRLWRVSIEAQFAPPFTEHQPRPQRPGFRVLQDMRSPFAARHSTCHGLELQTGSELLRSSSGYLFLLGIVVFSGSLYALSLSGTRWLGAITPIGGVMFLAGGELYLHAVAFRQTAPVSDFSQRS